jgi:hypothetical protein
VNQDGSYEKRIRCIVKIYNEQAIDDFSAQHVTYEPGIDSVENIRCAVINGGESIEATERYVRQLSDPESRLYYNLEAVMIQVPGLRRGSLLDFSYTLRNRGGAEFRNSYSETLHIGGPYRTMLYNIALSHPDERPIYMHRRGIEEGAVTVEHVNGSQLFRIRISDRAPVKNEAAMPPRQEILPALYFTSHRDWNDLALWYRSLLRNRMVVSDEMKRDLAAILSTEKKKLEIVRRIYNHVTGSIRYVGFELGIGALQPRSTDQTYHSRMGDCKDIALVLAAMLREAGIDASIALVQTRDRGKVNRSVPSTQGFNHALCHVNLEGGFFLDGTLNNSSFRELPPEDRDIEALVVNEKSWSFINTGSPLYEESVDSAVTEVIVDAEGGAAFRRELFKRGNAAALARQDLRDVKKKERTLNEYWNRIFPGSSVNSLKVADSSRDNPVKYGYGLRLKNYAVKAGKGLLFSPFPVQSDYYRSYAMNRTRRFPIIFSGPSRVESSMSIRVPQGFRPVSLPGGGTREHPLFSASFGYAYDAEKNIITLKSVVRFSTYSVPAEEYGAFRDLARFIQELESGKILLKRIAPGRGNS